MDKLNWIDLGLAGMSLASKFATFALARSKASTTDEKRKALDKANAKLKQKLNERKQQLARREG